MCLTRKRSTSLITRILCAMTLVLKIDNLEHVPFHGNGTRLDCTGDSASGRRYFDFEGAESDVKAMDIIHEQLLRVSGRSVVVVLLTTSG